MSRGTAYCRKLSAGWDHPALRATHQRVATPNSPFFFRVVYIIKQTTTDSTEPQAVASPIGSSVSGNHLDIKYAPGTRTSTMDRMLCMNESSLRPYAQK